MSKTLSDRVAIVTGASRGIGEEIALRLAAAGAKVVLASRKAPALQKVAEKIIGAGGEAMVVPTHMGKEEEIQPLVDTTLKAFGKIDILINNAATNPVFGPVMFCEMPAARKIFDINFFGPFMLAKACLEPMKKTGYGKIVNVGSVAGFKFSPMLGMYSMSKAALLMMTKVMAAEWGVFGIRVNALAPGLVKTDFSQALWGTEEILKQALDAQAFHQLAQPQDIAGAVLWLAGPDSDFITGQTIVIDGGQSL